ncbi:hypothetical protein PENSPDRAFT_759351 [Peniophora sp. CONT]|nr:hypothetical protein PENSPDRAFT_759351 [Peniophora sp. CONT]
MSPQNVSSFWSTRFERRSEELSEDIDVLSAEVEDLEYASKAYLSALRTRIENIRVEKAQSQTTIALSLPAEIYLHVCTFLAEVDPLGELCEYDACTSVIEDNGADDISSTTSTEFDGYANESYVGSETSDIRLSHGLGWSRVTHVCAKWRNWATHCATLWTTIPLDIRMPWLQELASRSRELPLDIIISCDVDKDVALRFLQDHIHRIRSITADGGSDVVEAILNDHRAPLLETLDIDTITSSSRFVLPGDLNSILPCLRVLNLRGVISSQKAFEQAALSQITHLAILSAIFPLSREGLFHLIQSLTCVRFLQLEDWLENPDGVGPFTDAPISLPSLETLILRNRMSACGAAMRFIKLPPSASVTLYILPDYIDSNSTAETTEQYMQRSGLDWLLETVDTSSYRALRISCTRVDHHVGRASLPSRWQLVVTAQRDADCVELDEYDLDGVRQQDQWSGPSFADLKIVCIVTIPVNAEDESNALSLGVFEQIIKTIPLASLTVLSLNIHTILASAVNMSWDYMKWLSILGEADNVRLFQLISPMNTERSEPDPHIEILLALCCSQEGSTRRLMPLLATISLVNIDADASSEFTIENVITIRGDREEHFTLRTTQVLGLLAELRNLKGDALRSTYPEGAWNLKYFNAIESVPLSSVRSVAPATVKRGWVEQLRRYLGDDQRPKGWGGEWIGLISP